MIIKKNKNFYVLQMIKHQLYKLGILIFSNAPLWLILTHFKINFLHNISPHRKAMKKNQKEFREFSKTLNFDNDWFTENIPTWLMAFQKSNYDRNSKLNCLEIGSWQGLSAVFILNYFKKAKLMCVDTWEGADEHKSLDMISKDELSKVETIFDSNLFKYKDRLTKYQGTSYEYFNDFFEKDIFDLIYVDGSHNSDDVIVDAIKAFEMLKVNGIIIFDDYFWKYYPNLRDNPAAAINSFVRLKNHQLKVVCFDNQLVVRKISSSIRSVD